MPRSAHLPCLRMVPCVRGRVFDDRNVAAVVVDGVRHSLEAAVGEQNVVPPVRVVAVAVLLVAEVVVVVVLDGILPIVVRVHLKIGIFIRNRELSLALSLTL